MSRLETPAADAASIPEEIPRFVLPNVGRGSRGPLYVYTRANQPVTIHRMLEAQLKDPHGLQLRHQMDLERNSRYSKSTDDLQMRVSPIDGPTQVYDPKELQKSILRLEPSSPQAGHPGVNRMYSTMRRLYYWETMANDVYKHVEACISCARSRLTQRKKTSKLRLFPAAEPCASLSIDIPGNLPETSSGNCGVLSL